MILLRTCDENGNNQFLPVELDMLYQECKHCGRIFPIGSICEFLKILYDAGFEIDGLNYCEDCFAERCECEAYYGEMPAVTLEDVRNLLAEKSNSGFTLEVKQLIAKFGGDRLSDINPSNYAALIKEAEAIGNK